jgi:hypothetical protein
MNVYVVMLEDPLASAMRYLNEPVYVDFTESCYPPVEAVALEKLLFSVVPLED